MRENIVDKDQGLISRWIESVEKAPFTQLHKFVLLNLVPIKDDIDGFIKKFEIKFEFEIKDKEKLNRYLTMFIEVLS